MYTAAPLHGPCAIKGFLFFGPLIMTAERLTDAVFKQLHALNNLHAEALSFTTPPAFQELWDKAYWGHHIKGQAFLIAFDHHSRITGENFDYISREYSQFVYVDRIVVSEDAQGMGYGRTLYGVLFRQAVKDAHTRILCEINIDPPNPGSVAFHEKLGFQPIGPPRLLQNGKTVQYFQKEL